MGLKDIIEQTFLGAAVCIASACASMQDNDIVFKDRSVISATGGKKNQGMLLHLDNRIEVGYGQFTLRVDTAYKNGLGKKLLKRNKRLAVTPELQIKDENKPLGIVVMGNVDHAYYPNTGNDEKESFRETGGALRVGAFFREQVDKYFNLTLALTAGFGTKSYGEHYQPEGGIDLRIVAKKDEDKDGTGLYGLFLGRNLFDLHSGKHKVTGVRALIGGVINHFLFGLYVESTIAEHQRPTYNGGIGIGIEYDSQD